MTKIKVSVRDIVEFVYKEGDISSIYQGGASLKILEEGTRLHKNYQQSQTEFFDNSNIIYKKEVSVKELIEYENIQFEISGRADSVILYDDKIIIEEIKTTSRNLDTLSFDINKAYMAQAMLYGYFLGKNVKDEFDIEVKMTYIKRFDESVKSYSKNFTKLELLDFFMDTIAKYYKFIKKDLDNKEEMTITGKNVPFPYQTYRKSQRAFMSAVYSSIQNKNKLFAEAPTGVGKTLSAIFPAIKALSNNLGKKIFYLTAKSITKNVCLESLYMLEEDGLKIMSLVINSKENMCENEKINCDARFCKRAVKHFDKINDVIFSIINNEKIMSEEIIKKYAKEYDVCPYYLQLDLMEFSHIIICDYNYVYNPSVCFSKYFEKEKNDFIILVDEAHNLESRSRSFFSASVKLSDFKFLENNISDLNIKNLSRSICKNINLLFENKENYDTINMPTSLIRTIFDLRFLMDNFLGENSLDETVGNTILEIYFAIDYFLKTSMFYDKKYRTLFEKTYKDAEITLFCIDTSTRFFKINTLCRSTVFFSATLTPINYFSDIFGGDKDDYFISLETSFDTENQLVIVDDTVSTFFKDRESSYKKVAEKIKIVTSQKLGNYFVFFPSYEFLEQTLIEFEKHNDYADVIIQSKNMTKIEKNEFLEKFEEYGERTLIGFLVLGGSFSEGVNLTGEKLIGAIVVGVGVSRINFKNDVIKKHYDETINKGYEFAYMYSGMNKVLQAGGRVIRTNTDRGVIMFIDSRFTRADYKKLFPKHLKNSVIVKDNAMLGRNVSLFWDKDDIKKL